MNRYFNYKGKYHKIINDKIIKSPKDKVQYSCSKHISIIENTDDELW